jgi:hypothetical protein
MKRKQIAEAIAANTGKTLYIQYGATTVVGLEIGLFEPISKTNAIKSVKAITEVKYGTYKQFRPDLDRYFAEGRIANADQEIVLFVA